MKVQDIMQVNVVTATPEMSLAQGQRLMHDEGIRHLPVVSGDRLIGMVSDRDLRDAAPSPATTLSKGEISYQLDHTPIRTCMTRHVITATPHDDTAQIVRTLLKHQFGGMPVVEGQRLVGMITETDCLRIFIDTRQDSADHAISSSRQPDPLVKTHMQTDVITVVPETLVSAVFQQMRGHHIRHIPVVTKEKQLVGLVTDRDIRRAGASDEPHLAQFDLNHLLQKVTVNTMMTTQLHTVKAMQR